MKIALLASARSPHTVKWANMLQKRVNNVTVFSLPEDKPEKLEFDSGISVNYLGLTKSDAGLKKNAKELKALLAAGKFDVVNAIDAETYGLMAAYAKVKYLLTVTGPDLFAAEGAAKGIVLKSIKASSAVCCPSAVGMQRVMALLKKKKKEMFIAPPGVDLYMFDVKPAREEGVVTFGCIKPLEELSGIDFLLDAYKEMKSKTEAKTKLVIIGAGSLENKLRQKAAGLGIEFEVEFKGQVPYEDIPAEINKMNALLNPASKEIFGVPTVEAMACGVPVIATDTEGSSEILLNGVTGYTVKTGKVSAFTYRMQEFANYPQNAEKMGSKTRGDVEDYFEINACTDKYVKALEYVKNA